MHPGRRSPEFRHRRQPVLLLSICPVLGLPKNELAGGSVVAKVKPVQNSGMERPFVDGAPSFTRIDTANHEIDLGALGDLLYLCLHALPVQTPEDVDPVCQHNSLRKADFGAAERLTHTVGLADRVGINQRYLQAARMPDGCGLSPQPVLFRMPRARGPLRVPSAR